MMPYSNWLSPQDRRPWLLAIGQHLKAEYEAVREPVPPRLAALVRQFEAPAMESNAEARSKSCKRNTA
jgi:hypothetical protein